MPNSITSTTTELVVLDMAGTTVTDDGLVLHAFDTAATAVGLPETGTERDDARRYVVDTMGQSKIEVFRALFGEEDRAQAANTAFEAAYEARIDNGITPVPGAADAITRMRDAGISVVLTTGFSATTQQRILDTLGWQDIADRCMAPSDAVRGRPHPDLVLAAALDSRVDDISNVVVVGDTSNDVRSGLRAGVSVVVGVLTGAHSADELRTAGATEVLDSVADLPALVLL